MCFKDSPRMHQSVFLILIYLFIFKNTFTYIFTCEIKRERRIGFIQEVWRDDVSYDEEKCHYVTAELRGSEPDDISLTETYDKFVRTCADR